LAAEDGVTHTIGVLGGSGLYELPGLENVREVDTETPFGAPSDRLVRGSMGGVDLVFLPRHGRGHHLLPHEVPYRANVWALKEQGCGWVVAIGAVGSLREHIAPGDAVLVDQVIDRTTRRESTFFGDGVVAHAAFADPICDTLRSYLRDACIESGITVHDGGVYVCMEGPAFSTRAESHLHRAWGADVVGMTLLPEAKLAREASMSYASVAFASDYDCWHPAHDAVTVEQVVAVLHANADRARRVVAGVASIVARHAGPAPMHDAMRTAFLTPRRAMPPEAILRLRPLLAPYED
jgi:5'-methylthioadenosine phosphorylase